MSSDTNGEVSVGCPLSSFFWGHGGHGEEWKSFQFNFHNFPALSYAQNDFIVSPTFNCNGNQWQLRLYPGGNTSSTEGFLSVELYLISEGDVNISFQVRIVDKFGNSPLILNKKDENFSAPHFVLFNWYDIFHRSYILDKSQNILHSDGTLTIVICMNEEPNTIFVPRNPLVRMMKGLFNDEASSDVHFQVDYQSDVTVKEEEEEKLKSSESFHAHRLILRQCAPMLADLLEGEDSATITNVKPDIFRHLLYYVYGGRVPIKDLEANAKEIIDAADKYAIVNLKLEAEAAYVGVTKITIDNAIDNLLYADGKNCALLKEKVLNFLAANPIKVSEMISSLDTEFLVHVMKDLLIAFGRSNEDASSETCVDELSRLSVSALRRRLHNLGLEVDGSREAMIECIKKSRSSS